LPRGEVSEAGIAARSKIPEVKSMIRIAVILILLAMLFPALPSADLQEYATHDKKWVKGPVRWLMTKDEIKAFKKIKDQAVREAFIEQFWADRDPTPGTEPNAYKDIFWRRVEEADRAFRTMMEAGALTDLGQVFILLGPPTSTDSDARNRKTWVYEPDPITGMKERMIIEFAPSNSGMLLLGKGDLEDYVEAHPETRGIGWLPPMLAQAPPELSGEPEYDPAEELSEESLRQIPILEAILSSGKGPVDVSFNLSYDFYATLGEVTLVVITLEVPRAAAHGSGDVALLPFARLELGDNDDKPINLTGELPFVPAPPDSSPADSFIYQARRNIAPGEYRIAAVVEDKVIVGQMGSVVETVTVPDYSGKQFEMSSVSLLAHIQQLGADLGPDGDTQVSGPYVLGSFRLVPRAVPILGRHEAFSFYYQVYNPATDPDTGRPDLEATYVFYLKEDGAWKPFRRPIQKAQGQVELYSIDLKDLLRPDQELPAEFKMEATLADKVAGTEIKREIGFTVR
jgi:GWxTD domain-containing protein